jgi:hypothetical protein
MGEVIDFSSRSVLALRPRDGYRAFEPSGRTEPCLFFVFRDKNSYLILRYAELESIASAPGEDANRVVLLRFHGSVTREVRIEGWRLMDLVRHLRWHRVAWVEEAPEGWDCQGDDGSTVVIHRISVREIRR